MADPHLTQTKPGKQVHRGLTMVDLPGKLRSAERLMRWAMFKAGNWPPAFWRVPVKLEGPALLQLLEERHVAFYANVGKGQGGRKEAQISAKE